MFRLSYLLPRLFLVACLLGLLVLCINPIVHYKLMLTGQRIVGATVNIGATRTHLAKQRIDLENVQVADPADPSRNLLEFAEGEFYLEREPLLQRRFVVRQAAVSGLRIGSIRDRRGAVDNSIQPLEVDAGTPVDGPAGLSAELASAAPVPASRPVPLDPRCLQMLDGTLQVDLQREMESLQLGEQLTQRMPEIYRSLGQELGSFKTRLSKMETELVQEGTNPLRFIPLYLASVEEITKMREQLTALEARVKETRHKVSADRDAIESAYQRDQQRLATLFQIADVRAEALSDYFLREQWESRLVRWVQWIREGRAMASGLSRGPRFTLVEDRGVDFLLGTSRLPDYLIRQLSFDGRGRLGKQEFTFVGTAQGVTNQADLYRQPMVIQLTTGGKYATQVEAVLDRSLAEGAKDQISIRCPKFPQPQRLLGNGSQLAVAVSPGEAELSIDLRIDGDHLSGQIKLLEPDAAFSPYVAQPNPQSRLLDNVQFALEQVEGLETTAILSGTVHDPQCQLESNLGPQLTHGLSLAIQRETESKRTALAASSKQLLELTLQRFDQRLQENQTALLDQIASNEQQIRAFEQRVARQLRDNRRIFGDALPADNLLR